MKITERFRAVLVLTAAVALATACSKSEPVASQPSPAPAMTADAPAATTATEPQPPPGGPVATFTPSTDTAAPMLGATPIQPPSDEHTQSPEKAAVKRIAPEEAAMLVQTGDAILVDVRSQDSFVSDHIRGAKHIPYAEIELRARQELPPTRWIIPYCT
jgi:hypothetical protein